MAKAKTKAPAKKARKSKASAADSTQSQNSAEQRMMIAEAAYFIAEHRGFVAGDELGDWLQAEREIQSSMQQQ